MNYIAMEHLDWETDSEVAKRDRWFMEHKYYFYTSEQHKWLIEAYHPLKELHDNLDSIRAIVRKDKNRRERAYGIYGSLLNDLMNLVDEYKEYEEDE